MEETVGFCQDISIRAEVAVAYVTPKTSTDFDSGELAQYKREHYLIRDGWVICHRPCGNSSSARLRCLLRREFSEPKRVRVVRRLVKMTGYHQKGYGWGEDYEPATFTPDRRHILYGVATDLDWSSLMLALPEDIVV